MHPNCHHQIIYCKFNLTIEYPPPDERVVWDLFFNKNAHEQVSILNRTLMDVFSNFIPNKLVTFNDKDPPWMTLNLRDKIN